MTELIDENELYDLAEIFKVFGDSTRIRILFALFDEEKSVNEIAKQLNMTILACDIDESSETYIKDIETKQACKSQKNWKTNLLLISRSAC